MPAMTASASRRFGTALGETKDVASILARPVADSRSISSILRSVGTQSGSICKPSRATTSWMKMRSMVLLRLFHQLDLAFGGHPIGFDLQAVAGDDVVDEDALHGAT